jgi:hypothetical protein
LIVLNDQSNAVVLIAVKAIPVVVPPAAEPVDVVEGAALILLMNH